MISCLYPDPIGTKALEWALGGQEFPLGLGTISSGIFSGTDLSLPFISNHRRRLEWKQKPQDDLKSCCPIFRLLGVSCSPHTWGHSRIQNCIKECQVVFSPLPRENDTDVGTLYSFLSPFSQHLNSESPTNAQRPKIIDFFPWRSCSLPATNL